MRSGRYKPEQIAGLLFVVALHGAALYGLWSYRILPAPAEETLLMVNLVNPPPAEKQKRPDPPRPHKAKHVEPPKPQQIVAEAPAAKPEEPIAPPPPLPVIESPPLPEPPMMLNDDLAVNCPDRSPPEYPAQSRRLNEQGKVVLRVELGKDGRVDLARIRTSSGYPRLDEAALEAIRKWHCRPPVRDGSPVRAVALQPFNFTLEGS